MLSFIFLLCLQLEWQILFYLVIDTKFGLLVRIEQSLCISKSQRILCISFSWTDSDLCLYNLSAWSNFKLLHNSQWITFPTQSCLVLYSFCASLLHSLIMWLVVSSLLAENLHLQFFGLLIFALTLLVPMTLFWVAGMMVRVFAYDLGDWGSIPGLVFSKIKKIVLDATLLQTQHYGSRISGAIQGKE